MARCIQLAKNGCGTTYPNPMVGAVIVHEDKIIGEGWHPESGSPHAEVNAVHAVTDKNLLRESTIYVSLEPCSHYGKTPPCVDLILKAEIPRIVIGSTDPNPKVAGGGIRKLREAGREVLIGVFEEQCDKLNKRFFTYHLKKRPFIILKWAETSDGFIAPGAERHKKGPVWISNVLSRQRVHKMRSEEQAILVGSNTLISDDPSLTTRDWSGPSPLRLVLSDGVPLPNTSKVFDGKAPTIVFQVTEKSIQYPNAETVDLDGSKNIIDQLCKELYDRSIQSLIVEGGRKTLESFINADLWDEAYIFKSPVEFDYGIGAPQIEGKLIATELLAGDTLTRLKKSTP